MLTNHTVDFIVPVTLGFDEAHAERAETVPVLPSRG
jgi:hypothetical protein